MKGVEFWLGFLQNNESDGNIILKLAISSEVSTEGQVSIPLQGWSQNFSVNAGSVTQITVPTSLAQNKTHGIIDSKAIFVTSNDSITLFALNNSQFTSDGSFIIPTHCLGSEYFTISYNGFSESPNDVLIVAGKNDTKIEVIPSTNTLNGWIGGSKNILNLQAGQSYLIKSANGKDLSGTRIKGIDNCLPFAVFSGAKGSRIPENCVAVDHIFHQMLPTDYFGLNYFLAPVNNEFTFKIVATEDYTTIAVNGTQIATLNKTENYFLNQLKDAIHISADKPVIVAQFLQGYFCSNTGDPAMAVIPSAEYFYSKAMFSTAPITNIDAHFLNIIIKTKDINQFKIDGVPDGTGFSPFSSYPDYSWKTIPVTPGFHLIEAENGLSATVFGTSTAHSYFYPAGYSGDKSLDFIYDTPLCSENIAHFKGFGPGISDWEWDFGDGNIGKGKNIDHTYQTPGLYKVTLTKKRSGSPCEESISYLLEVLPAPDFTIFSDTLLCQNSTNIFEAIGENISFLWSTGDTSSKLELSQPGLYWLEASDGTCTKRDTIKLISIKAPDVSIGNDTAICENSSLILTANGTDIHSFYWSSGEISEEIIISSEGLYWIEGSNKCGFSSDSIKVSVYPAPITSTSPDTVIFLGVGINIETSGGINYSWSPPAGLSCIHCPTTFARPQQSTTYIVTVTNDIGCSSTDSVTVEVDPHIGAFVPNAFSPNGDGKNDILFVRGKGIKEMRFMIFNRWGEKIFETKDINNGWDGTFRGEILPPFVYVFYLDAELENMQKLVQKGDINLIR